MHKYFKNYYKKWIHLVFKYAFNDVVLGSLVLEHKFHQQCLCTLLKMIGIWHPLTVLFMIFLFKDGLLFIKIMNILKQIACKTNLLIIVLKKRLLTAATLLTAVTRAPPSVPDVVNCAICYMRLMYVVLYQKFNFHNWDSKFNQISFKGWEGDDYTTFWKNWQMSW